MFCTQLTEILYKEYTQKLFVDLEFILLYKINAHRVTKHIKTAKILLILKNKMYSAISSNHFRLFTYTMACTSSNEKSKMTDCNCLCELVIVFFFLSASICDINCFFYNE